MRHRLDRPWLAFVALFLWHCRCRPGGRRSSATLANRSRPIGFAQDVGAPTQADL